MVKHISKIAHGSDVYYIKDTEARSALIDKAEKGAANGVATLDSGGKVPSSQLPSYVDDIIEGYFHSEKFYSTYTSGDGETEDIYTDEITPETGKIYVDKNTNSTYRWSGSMYVNVSSNLPENISYFTNDAGYLTEHQDISSKADKSELSGYITTLTFDNYKTEMKDREKVISASLNELNARLIALESASQ